jgi:hypothetical protein
VATTVVRKLTPVLDGSLRSQLLRCNTRLRNGAPQRSLCRMGEEALDRLKFDPPIFKMSAIKRSDNRRSQAHSGFRRLASLTKITLQQRGSVAKGRALITRMA